VGGGRNAVPSSTQGVASFPALAALTFLLAVPAFVPFHVPSADLDLVPESERPCRRVVIGLDPMNSAFFLFPKIEPLTGRKNGARLVRLRHQLFHLRLALDRGSIMRHAPADTIFFVGVPEPTTVPEATGSEADALREYLRERAGWSTREIAERVRIFEVSDPIPFPQDMAEGLGFDHQGRLVFGIGGDTDEDYRGPVLSLAETFPDDFGVRTLGRTGEGSINTEGGDLSVIWLPNGQVGVLVGRHRIVRFLENRYDRSLAGEAIDQAMIEEARQAFSKAFFGREVIIAGEPALRHPGWVNDDVFHADMVVTIMRCNNQVVAFVPTFEGRPVDAIFHKPLSPERQAMVQQEYDLVARQMKKRGFAVVRLPFADHPVRNPVNVSKYLDPSTGRHVVLLERYPYHLASAPGAPIPQFQLQDAIHSVSVKVKQWYKQPNDARWQAVQASIEAAWKTLGGIADSPNPLFSKQVALFEANGVEVLPVPMCPSGEGGLHCMILR
jgi:hypothetical protein